jgi:hypothetical protein
MPRKAAMCPPGVWCLTPTLGFVFVIGVCIALYFVYLTISGQTLAAGHANQNSRQPIQIFNPPAQIIDSASGGGDDRYTRSPEPLRFWRNGPDLRGGLIPPGAVRVNVPTRGLPEAFQQMGIIKTGEQILPLYGRQTAYRTDRYNYYTRTDTYNPVQLPVRYERRDCMDSIGCDELLGGENIQISGLGKQGSVEVYKFDGPTYIPGLV